MLLCELSIARNNHVASYMKMLMRSLFVSPILAKISVCKSGAGPLHFKEERRMMTACPACPIVGSDGMQRYT